MKQLQKLFFLRQAVGEEKNLHVLSVVNAAIYFENGSFVKIDNLRGTVQAIVRVRIFHTFSPADVPVTTRWQHSLLPNCTYLQQKTHFNRADIDQDQQIRQLSTYKIGKGSEDTFAGDRLHCKSLLSGFHKVREGPKDTPSTEPSIEKAASFTGWSR